MAHDESPRWTADEAHTVPDGVSDETVQALGTLSKALETLEQARGHLYALHQLTGTTDLTLGQAVDELREAGHTAMADRIETELVGRNLLAGRWTFQVVEEFDDGYYATFKELEWQARRTLAAGRRHLHEARMKEERRTNGRPGHEALPDTAVDVSDDGVRHAQSRGQA